MRMSVRTAVCAFVFLLFSAAAFAQDGLLTRAKQLLDNGDAQGAYNVLKPLESDRAGDPDYDLLLGIAAVETKRNTEAVFALERVLAVRPNDARARAEIARVYFLLGERRTSEIEFEQIKSRPDIPPDARATIEKYLDAIAQTRDAARTAITGYAEVTFGDDSNVNTAPSTIGGVVPPITAGVTPGTKVRDTFISLAGGAAVRHAVNDQVALLGNLDFSQRFNNQVSTVDIGFFNASAGVNYSVDEQNSFTFALQAQEFYIDSARFRDAFGFVGQYQRLLDDNSALTFYAQYSKLEHPGAPLRDVDRLVGGFGYARALKGARDAVIFAGAYAGSESERNACLPGAVACFGNDLWGVRLGGQITLAKDLVLFAAGSFEQRNYNGPFFPSPSNRDDKQSDARFGLNYTFAPLWTLSPQIAYTRNRSNAAVFDFERVQAMITLRRDFR